MNLLKKIFSKASAKASEAQTPPVANKPISPIAEPAKTGLHCANWYVAAPPGKAVRQLVLTFPAGTATDTEFATIMLSADRTPILATESWCAGFCRINGKDVLMMRAGDFAGEVKNAGVTVALSFCHMPSHPLFLVSIRVDSRELGPKVSAKYISPASLSCPIAEWVCGLGEPYDKELIPSVFAAEPFRLVVCEESTSRNSVRWADGNVDEGFLPRAVCEFRMSLPAEARQALQSEWKELLRHDASVPAGLRDFTAAAGTEIARYLPLDKDPVLPRK